MNKEYVAKRIAELRTKKNVSARDMSLTLGQNQNYINHIENHLTSPSMQIFLYICDYFGISPKEFFDEGNKNPETISKILGDLKKLDEKQLLNVHELIKDLIK